MWAYCTGAAGVCGSTGATGASWTTGDAGVGKSFNAVVVLSYS